MQPDGSGPSAQGSIPLSEKVKSISITESAKCCIFKVHNHLRKINKEAYEPEIIAIGPYHHKQKRLLMMEYHKLRYLHLLLQRENENLERYIRAIKPLEKQVRECYAEPISLNSDELIEMMVLDGCFIVELVRKYRMKYMRGKDDPVFNMKWIIGSLRRDLMLFENQIPFFVIRQLFNMIEAPNEQRLVYLFLIFFNNLLPNPKHKWSTCESSRGEVKHLLDLIHINWLPPETARNGDWNFDADAKKKIHCATELREAGVKFEEKDGVSPFGITFQNGTLQIPRFVVEDRTESFWRNLIAHEQYCETDRLTFVTDYVKLLDCLIDSPKDVKILSQRGIIENWQGDDEVVSRMFNKITDSVILESDHFFYERIFKEVNDHCNSRCNQWMAILWHKHLDNPWRIISIVAAIILLLLTLTQTIFTVFPRK